MKRIDYKYVVERIGRILDLTPFHERYSTSDYSIFRHRYEKTGKDLHWVDFRDKRGNQIIIGPCSTGKQPDSRDYERFVRSFVLCLKGERQWSMGFNDPKITLCSSETADRIVNSFMNGVCSVEELIMKMDLNGV